MPIITPIAVLSYPNLFTPRLPNNPKPKDQPRYQATLLFLDPAKMEPAEKALWDAMNKEVLAMGVEAWGREYFTLLLKAEPKKVRLPYKSPDPKKYGEEFKYQIDVWTTQAPGLVSRYKGADGKPIILDNPKEFYPGCKVRAQLNARAYPKKGVTDIAKGIGLYLQNLQKWADGDRLDNRVDAQDAFSADMIQEEANLSSLGAGGAPTTAANAQQSGDELNDLLG